MAKQAPPVLVRNRAVVAGERRLLRFLSAFLGSFVTHGALVGLFLLIIPSSRAVTPQEVVLDGEEADLTADAPEAPREDHFDTFDIDWSGLNPGGDIANPESSRTADLTVPGLDDPTRPVGTPDGSPLDPPVSTPPPTGFGPFGLGGPADIPGGIWKPGEREPGGNRPGPQFAHRTLKGASGATRDLLLKRGGGTGATEAAVARGLKWLARQQSPDGRWMLDGAFKDKGANNDTAGTAFGLLPFLGAGMTHKPAADNPYDKVVHKGLAFLIRTQDRRTGYTGGGMYGHGLATIALCEAYGLTQDPNLRKPAHMAVQYIVTAQHEKGGWRYSPGQEGDTSVTGWQIMALKSAQMAGLDVPPLALKRAERFLDSVRSADTEGYGYVSDGATPTMSAVGLLCRQYLHGWGPQNPRLLKGISAHLKTNPPDGKKDVYYTYYATQVMYHFGGESWQKWNERMRDQLVKSQEVGPTDPQDGSWSSAGDVWGRQGGRLMVTSLNLLTLEVYYRYLPLYSRNAAARADEAPAKGL